MRELKLEPVRAVERSSQILDCFTYEKPNLTIDEIVGRTGLAKATTYRLLWTMERNGLIQFDQRENRYRLGYKLLEYGGIVLENADIRREAEPHLQKLFEKTDLTTILAVPQGETVQYLIRLESGEGLQPRNFVGRRRILHNGAFGITLLAYMPENFVRDLLERHPLEQLTPYTIVEPHQFLQRLRDIREQGYIVDVDETFVGYTAIVAPILGQNDKAIASIGISSQNFKAEGEAREHLIQQITEAAQTISRNMGMN